MNRDVSAFEPSEALLPRPRIAAWADAPGVSTWILVAGPGWGKTCAARLIANALGLPQRWLPGEATSLEGLGQELGLSADLAPESLAEALRNHMLQQHPSGATLVLDGVEQGAVAPDFARFMRAWLAQSEPPLRTIMTSRGRLPVKLARKLAEGSAVFYDVEALRLNPEEEAAWLGGDSQALALAAPLAGWSLGVKALATLASHPRADYILAAILEEELLDPLSTELRRAAATLSLLSNPSPQVALLIGLEPAAVFEPLFLWGLLIGRTLEWHPLARRLLQAEWRSRLSAHERAEQQRRAATWLATHDPQQAIALLLEAGDQESAFAVLRDQATKLRMKGEFEQLARLIALFGDRHAGDPRLLLIEGLLQEAKGFATEARARYQAAADAFEQRGDRPRLLEAQNYLMRLAFDLDDFEAFATLREAAEPLVPDAELAERVEHLNLLGCYYYVLGDEDAACRHFLRVLDFPHFDQLAIAANHQIAASNLGIVKMNRGEFASATLHFQHVVALSDAFQFRRPMRRRVTLHLALIAFHLGDHARGERLYQEQAADPAPLENSHTRCHLLMQEADCLLLQGALSEAEAKYLEVLSILNAGGGAERIDIANTRSRLAIIRRRRGEIEPALRLHAQSMQGAEPWPRHKALFLMQWGLTLLAAGAYPEAVEKLAAARAGLAGSPARTLELDILLALAVAHERSGQGEEARQVLAAGVALILQLSVYYAPIALPEISPVLWRLLLQHGHGALLAKIESLFPAEATAVRSELERSEQGNGPLLPPLAPAALQIRCFGSLEVSLASNPPAHWPRKKAKALLGMLLFSPQGMSREALCDALFSESDEAQPERHLHDLTSALRKTLEPELAPRQPSRYLTSKDGWYHLSKEGIWWDIAEFERAYADGKREWEAGERDEAIASFEAAVALYRADVLSEPALAEWFETERQRYRVLLLEMLFLLSDHHLESEHLERGRSFTERILQLDPANEEAHRRLMALYGRFGQRELVRKQYEQCVRALRQAFDLAPAAETLILLDRLTQA